MLIYLSLQYLYKIDNGSNYLFIMLHRKFLFFQLIYIFIISRLKYKIIEPINGCTTICGIVVHNIALYKYIEIMKQVSK